MVQGDTDYYNELFDIYTWPTPQKYICRKNGRLFNSTVLLPLTIIAVVVGKPTGPDFRGLPSGAPPSGLLRLLLFFTPWESSCVGAHRASPVTEAWKAPLASATRQTWRHALRAHGGWCTLCFMMWSLPEKVGTAACGMSQGPLACGARDRCQGGVYGCADSVSLPRRAP